MTRALSLELSPKQRAHLAKASTHWLRHTFGTRAVAVVSMDVVQAQMGHADIRTTMNIYGKAPLELRVSELASWNDPT